MSTPLTVAKIEPATPAAPVGMTAIGVNGQITLLPDRIRISRAGLMAFISQGLKGDKEIQIAAISSIQLKPASIWARGYIQFAFHGGAETKGGLWQSTSDENSILFNSDQQPAFERIRDEINRRQATRNSSAGNGVPSAANEIRKLAALRDEGILTAQEFEAKNGSCLGFRAPLKLPFC